MSFVLFVALCLLVSLSVGQSGFVKFKQQRQKLAVRSEKFAHPYDVSKSVQFLQNLRKGSHRNPATTLAVMMVFNFPLYPNGTHPRLDLLRCALHKLYLHIGSTTPLDVYLWMNATSIPRVPQWFYAEFPEVLVVPIEEDSWKLPQGISPPSTWSFINYFSKDYHIMGRWRLTYAFDFVRAMGYKYMLQIDDDTLMMQNINFNIVDTFNATNIAFGYRDKIYQDDPVVLLSLAELAKYWLVSRGVASPPGTLFKHLTPPNMDGLSSAGWDRQVFIAAFMVINIDFWYEEPVQDFLNLALSTGGELTQRWLEQAVINMISLLFLPEHNIRAFKNSNMIHDKVTNPRTFRLLGCAFTPVNTLQGIEDTADANTVALDTNTGAVSDIEFLVAWEFVGMNTVNFQPSEVLLFHWRYDIAACGANTAVLNNYFKTLAEVDFGNWMLPEWWDKYDIHEIHSALFEKHDIISTSSSVGDDGSLVVEPVAQCADVLRNQLLAYVNFYCLYTASKQGERIVEYCNGIRNGAVNTFNMQVTSLL